MDGEGVVIRTAYPWGEEWQLWRGEGPSVTLIRLRAGHRLDRPILAEFAIYTVVGGHVDVSGVKYADGGRFVLTAGQTASIQVDDDREFVDVIEQLASAAKVAR